MSDGLRDAFKYFGKSYQQSEVGDGENRYTVFPDDPRWISSINDSTKFPWDEDTEEILKIREWTLSVPMHERTCECGAEKTPNKTFHSRWCPKFEDPMRGKDS